MIVENFRPFSHEEDEEDACAEDDDDVNLGPPLLSTFFLQKVFLLSAAS